MSVVIESHGLMTAVGGYSVGNSGEPLRASFSGPCKGVLSVTVYDAVGAPTTTRFSAASLNSGAALGSIAPSGSNFSAIRIEFAGKAENLQIYQTAPASYPYATFNGSGNGEVYTELMSFD